VTAQGTRHKSIALTSTMAPASSVPTLALNLGRFEDIQRREGTWEKDDKLETILKKAAAVPSISTGSASSELRNAGRALVDTRKLKVEREQFPDSWHNHLDARGLLGRLTIDDVCHLQNVTTENTFQLLVMVKLDHEDGAFIQSASKFRKWYKDYPAEIANNMRILVKNVFREGSGTREQKGFMALQLFRDKLSEVEEFWTIGHSVLDKRVRFINDT
jgi:hypothetical protein